jgi:hypothetical protein
MRASTPEKAATYPVGAHPRNQERWDDEALET